MSQEYYIGCTRKLEPSLIDEAKSKRIAIHDRDLIQVELISSPVVAQRLRENTAPLVFTSRHAVTAVGKLINQYHISLQTKKAFAIEGKTSQLALEAGFELLATAPDSGMLAQRIVSFQNLPQLLHLSTNIRLHEWKKILVENRFVINTLEVYHKTINPGIIRADDGVLLFSPSQAVAFFNESDLPKYAPAFCIGATTADKVAELLHTNIQVSEQPSEKEILHTVYRYYNLI